MPRFPAIAICGAMKKFLTPFFLIVMLAALVAGCSSNNSTTAGLKVELTGLTRAGDGGTRVAWRVVNPNVISYIVAQVRLRVYVDGVLIGTVTERDPLAVPAQSHADRASPLVSAGSDAERKLAAASAAGAGAYRLESAVLVQLYGDITDKSNLIATGTVPVTTK